MKYTGIGSRETPAAVQARMIRIAHLLGEQGWTLRSGGAEGADSAFEHGAQLVSALGPYPNMEIYLPWKKFNGRPIISPPYYWDKHIPSLATLMAQEIHPAWDSCSQGAKKLHTRNICQVLGLELNDKSDAVICWTLDGRLKGGTRTALVLAKKLHIPIWNLADAKHSEKTVESIVAEVLAIQA